MKMKTRKRYDKQDDDDISNESVLTTVHKQMYIRKIWRRQQIAFCTDELGFCEGENKWRFYYCRYHKFNNIEKIIRKITSSETVDVEV